MTGLFNFDTDIYNIGNKGHYKLQRDSSHPFGMTSTLNTFIAKAASGSQRGHCSTKHIRTKKVVAL